MTFLFLVLLFVFVIFPLAKGLWRVFQMQRSWRKATEGFRQAYQQAAGRREHPAPKPKKKKIDPNVGEYVAFEEIQVESTTTNSDGSTTTTTYTESQIEDITWEEI